METKLLKSQSSVLVVQKDSLNIASGLFCEALSSVGLFFVAIQDERGGPVNAELSGKVGSSLPVPPEENKLKDDYIVNVQVRFVALIF